MSVATPILTFVLKDEVAKVSQRERIGMFALQKHNYV
jgi:hypothetical protein